MVRSALDAGVDTVHVYNLTKTVTLDAVWSVGSW